MRSFKWKPGDIVLVGWSKAERPGALLAQNFGEFVTLVEKYILGDGQGPMWKVLTDKNQITQYSANYLYHIEEL